MKVLLVSRAIPKNVQHRMSNFVPRMLHMPCTLLQAKTNRELLGYYKEADIILLNTTSHNRWVPENSPIYGGSVPIGRLFGDVWKIPALRRFANEPKKRSRTGTLIAEWFRNYDFRVSTCWQLFKKCCPEWIDNTFWSPHCVDVQDYNVPKDIDVLFWGAVRASPPRRDIGELLQRCASTPVVQKDKAYSVCKIRLGKREYTYVRVGSKHELYRGAKLYELISRAKVCCTAPIKDAPVGKYFENAACGSVTLSPDFTDRVALGFEHKKNIWISGLEHYLRNLQFLLEHNGLVQEMSKNAKELIRARHTLAIRGQELYECFKQATGKE